jgi:16S rRNA (adenine1518-N6/adenine1519-N6)-dimethyltransferase
MDKNNFNRLPRPDKDLGQHFLKDKNVIEKITNDFKDECDLIVEVGPGPAILSKELANFDKPYYFIEKDERFKEQLFPITPEKNQYFADALKFDWYNFINENNLQDKKIWLVSNLPYNVSSPLFISFLQVPQIKYMSLMFQKEVGEKTYIREKTKNQMGSLLSLSLNYFQPKKLINVHPGAFHPPPKVESVVVSYERIEEPTIKVSDFKAFERFLRLTFSMKRKQLGSVYKSQIAKENVEELFNISGIASTVRSEALEMQDIYKLYQAYKEVNK